MCFNDSTTTLMAASLRNASSMTFYSVSRYARISSLGHAYIIDLSPAVSHFVEA